MKPVSPPPPTAPRRPSTPTCAAQVVKHERQAAPDDALSLPLLPPISHALCSTEGPRASAPLARTPIYPLGPKATERLHPSEPQAPGQTRLFLAVGAKRRQVQNQASRRRPPMLSPRDRFSTTATPVTKYRPLSIRTPPKIRPTPLPAGHSAWPTRRLPGGLSGRPRSRPDQDCSDAPPTVVLQGELAPNTGTVGTSARKCTLPHVQKPFTSSC